MNNAQTKEDTARDQAIAQAQSIAVMVAALEVDYDRLEELREERDDWISNEADQTNASARWGDENLEDAIELNELEEAAGDCDDEDDARQRIQEDALSVEVRSGWSEVGDDMTAEEFRIVLCTGGPHVEIRGELSQGEPSRAWIEYKGWGGGESGELSGNHCEQAALLRYASEFFYS